MRRAACILSLIAMVLGALWMVGCGDVDALDESDDAYIYSMALDDGFDEGSLTIDIVQVDCDGNIATTDDIEEFYDLFAVVTVSVASGVAGLRLDHYRLEYIPLPSSDSSGVLVNAPDLGGPLYGTANLDIGPGETSTISFTLMTTETKYEMYADSGFLADPWTLRYTMRVTLYFEDYGGNEKEFVLEKTAYFANYDNC